MKEAWLLTKKTFFDRSPTIRLMLIHFFSNMYVTSSLPTRFHGTLQGLLFPGTRLVQYALLVWTDPYHC